MQRGQTSVLTFSPVFAVTNRSLDFRCSIFVPHTGHFFLFPSIWVFYPPPCFLTVLILQRMQIHVLTLIPVCDLVTLSPSLMRVIFFLQTGHFRPNIT